MKIEIQTHQLSDGRYIAVLDVDTGNALVHIAEDEYDAIYGAANDLLKGQPKKTSESIRAKLQEAQRSSQVVRMFYHDGLAFMTHSGYILAVGKASVRFRNVNAGPPQSILIDRIKSIETSN